MIVLNDQYYISVFSKNSNDIEEFMLSANGAQRSIVLVSANSDHLPTFKKLFTQISTCIENEDSFADIDIDGILGEIYN